MKKTEYEERIKALENEVKLIRERYQILVETTSALLFEYKPDEDVMIFNYNFPDNKERKVIEDYHKYVEISPLVHPDHLKKFMDILEEASTVPMRGEMEYLSKVSGGEFQWHRTYYSSITDKDGKVLSVLGRIQNVHQLTTERQEMIHRVETDFLTGFYNEGAATEKITRWMKENPTREAQLIIVNLDDFKRINDACGYVTGDEILKDTTRIIESCFAGKGILSRFGGVKFVIFLIDESIRGAQTHVDEMVQKLTEEITYMEQPLCCSVGIASRVPKYDEFEDLLNRADNALYTEKGKAKTAVL